MLVLTRKTTVPGESGEFVRLFLPDGSFIDVHVTEVRDGGRCRLGFEAGESVVIVRSELLQPDGYPPGWKGPRPGAPRRDGYWPGGSSGSRKGR